MARWLAFLAVGGTLLGQTPRRPNLVSPEVHDDGRVTVRFWAPNSTRAQLSGDWMGPQPPVDLSKGADGVWTATVGPLDPNIYSYGFLVDGVRTNDPSCRCGFMIARRTAASSFVVRGPAPQSWDERNVPTGVIHEEKYFSRRQQRVRRFQVYTPAGYRDSRTRYPAMLLMPGTPGEEDDWTRGGGFADRIFDSLIADRKMRSMIVVMHPSDVLVKGGTRADNLKELEPLLVEELIPEVKRRYRTESKPESWAIAGISLGGEAAMTIGLRHPELFLSVASMGGSVFEKEFEDRFGKTIAAPETARKYRLIWLRCGAGDVFYPGNKALAAKLASVGIPVNYQEGPGFHVLPLFRRQLAELLPLLFANK